MRAVLMMAALLAGSGAAQAGIVNVARNASNVGHDVNIVNATTVSGQLNHNLLLCGESSAQESNKDTRPYLPFVLSESDKAQIAAGAKVTFTVYVVSQAYFTTNAIDLYGIGGKGTTASAATADYSGGELIKSDFIKGAFTNGQAFTADVTSFVINQVANNSVVAFRLQMSTTPEGGGDLTNVSINSGDAANTDVRPVLTITPVPEAASLGVLGAGASALLLGGRRK